MAINPKNIPFNALTASLTKRSNPKQATAFDLMVKSQRSAALTKRSNTNVNHSFDQKVKSQCSAAFDLLVKHHCKPQL